MRKSISFVKESSELVCDLCGTEWMCYDLNKAMKREHYCVTCERRRKDLEKIKKSGKREIEQYYRNMAAQIKKCNMKTTGDVFVDFKVKEMMEKDGVIWNPDYSKKEIKKEGK